VAQGALVMRKGPEKVDSLSEILTRYQKLIS
jgi:hypothetical protein